MALFLQRICYKFFINIKVIHIWPAIFGTHFAVTFQKQSCLWMIVATPPTLYSLVRFYAQKHGSFQFSE
jgi:hypothetical protein